MRRVLKQILLFILVTDILFTNIQISQAASTGTVRVNDFYQMKSQEESTIIKEEKSQEEGNQEKDSSDYKDKENKKEDKKEEKKEEKDKEDVINNTVGTQEEKNEVIPEEQEKTEKKAESRTEKEEGYEDSIKDAKEPEQVQEATKSQQSKEEEEREQLERASGYTLRTVRPDTNHSVTMPDITSHYFLLQKNSKKVNAASGGNLVVVADANAASKYIYEIQSFFNQYAIDVCLFQYIQSR